MKWRVFFVAIFLFFGGLQSAMAFGPLETPFTDRVYGLSRGWSSGHQGIDFDTPNDIDVDVVASAQGWVTTWVDGYDNRPTCKCYGNYIVLDHSGGLSTLYAHLEKSTLSASVRNYRYVRSGEYLAKEGNSGNSSGDHLHFESRINNRSVDPSLKPATSAGYLWTASSLVVATKSPSTLQRWDFKTGIQGWGYKNLTHAGNYAGEYWKMDPGLDPYVYSNELSGVGASTLHQLKIRMGVKGSGAEVGKVYFKTDVNDSWSESKSVSFTVYKDSNASQRVYTVAMGGHASWAGSIAQIRIDPIANYPSDTVSEVYIDYVAVEPGLEINRLYRASNDTRVYWYNGSLHPYLSQESFLAWPVPYGTDWGAIRVVDSSTLAGLPNGNPMYYPHYTAVRERNDTKVYFIEQSWSGQQIHHLKRHIQSEATLFRLGFSWSSVRVVPDGELRDIPTGSVIP